MQSCRLLLLLLLGASSAQLAVPQTLQMLGSEFNVELVEGNEREPKHVLRKQYKLVLECVMQLSDGSKLPDPIKVSWRKTGENSTVNPEHDSRYTIGNTMSEDRRNLTSVLSLRNPGNDEVTNFTCAGSAGGNLTAEGQARVLSMPLITFSVDGNDFKVNDVSQWPGMNLLIKCVVEGNPVGSVEWFKKLEDGEFVSLANSSMLNMTDLNYERDRGFVSCRSSNRFGTNSAKIFLRVKHPQAFLPPLLIIIGEVVIIGIVVLVYELYMSRKRKAQAESDTMAAYKAE